MFDKINNASNYEWYNMGLPSNLPTDPNGVLKIINDINATSYGWLACRTDIRNAFKLDYIYRGWLVFTIECLKNGMKLESKLDSWKLFESEQEAFINQIRISTT